MGDRDLCGAPMGWEDGSVCNRERGHSSHHGWTSIRAGGLFNGSVQVVEVRKSPEGYTDAVTFTGHEGTKMADNIQGNVVPDKQAEEAVQGDKQAQEQVGEKAATGTPGEGGTPAGGGSDGKANEHTGE
jgi:hypothetical protein